MQWVNLVFYKVSITSLADIKLSKGVTCSMDKSDDLFSAEEPNDESYHDNTIEDRMNLDKSLIRKILGMIVVTFP